MFVMMAATMLAGIVVGIVKSEPVQASLRQVILCSVPFLYDENGEPSCKAGKYMAKEDPKPEKPDPPEDEFSPIPLHTKPEPTPPVKPVKSDPSWYECALSWDCIKKKGGELLSGPSEEKKKQLREERIKRLLEEARKHCGNDSECIANYVGKRLAYDQMGTLPQLKGLIGFSKLIGAITGVDPFYEWVSFGVDHPEFTIGLAATIIALFVSPPLGGTMLVSGAISGGVSWLQGNDPNTILRDAGIGGFAGVFGYGVFAGVTRYAGAKLAQSTLNPFLQKWLPKIIGGGSGGVADQSTFDWLRDRKLDWRSATIAGMIGLLIPYAGAVIDGAPALSKPLLIPGVSGDGTLAMPWVKKNGQEAAEGYNKASGNGGGGQSGRTDILRKTPGTVEGNGWGNLDKMMIDGRIGLIPDDVANQLTGRRFNTFKEFREEFWKVVGNSKYASEFSHRNQTLMRQGKAPFAPRNEQLGGKGVYELHHLTPLEHGGEVYSLDNLVIASPYAHYRGFHNGMKR
ncbi:hypothetical protein JOD24_003407 [Kroppenstedtia sanguinis]